jgi:hypothetical protein
MSEGWYPDPEEPGSLRWWDGTNWTEHRHRPPTEEAASEASGGARVQVAAGKGLRKEIALGDQWISFDGETFAFAEIDTVHWTAVQSRLNGAYMGVSYMVRVRAGDRKGEAVMDTGSHNARIDEFSDAYSGIVSDLDALVCPRLASDMATRMRAGQTVTLGPAGARVELSAPGFRLKKPLSKVVPWDQVAGTEMEGGRLWFLLHQPGKDPKRHSTVPLDGDNIVVLPHLVRLLSATG